MVETALYEQEMTKYIMLINSEWIQAERGAAGHTGNPHCSSAAYSHCQPSFHLLDCGVCLVYELSAADGGRWRKQEPTSFTMTEQNQDIGEFLRLLSAERKVKS